VESAYDSNISAERCFGVMRPITTMPEHVLKITSNPTEADTCRLYVVPKLQAAGWDAEPHSIAEQRGVDR